MTKNDVNLNEIVVEDYKPKMSDYNGKYSKTALFLLQMIGLSLRHRLILKFMRNAFIDDKGIEHDFTRPIFVLFSIKNMQDKEWAILEDVLKKNESRITDYYVGVDSKTGMNYVMYVFQVPDNWKEDFYHFKAGRYSKMSDEYKAKHPKDIIDPVHGTIESVVWGAMHKSDKLKDRVAKEFSVKDEKGRIKDKLAYNDIRSALDTAAEIWDRPNKEEEYFRYNNQTENDTNSLHGV